MSTPNNRRAIHPAAPSSPDTSGVKNGAWAGLSVDSQDLRDTPAMFGPLVSAANVLLDCFDTIEAVARNQQDYEQLATELDALSKLLVTTCNEVAPAQLPTATIKREANESTANSSVGLERALMANADEQDLMRRYRRIQSLFRQLQTNIGMSTWANTNELVAKSRLGELNAEKKATYDSQLSGPTNRRTCTEGTRVKVLDELKAWVIEAAGQVKGHRGAVRKADTGPLKNEGQHRTGWSRCSAAGPVLRDQSTRVGIYATMAAHAASHEAIHLHKIEESLVSADIKLYLEEVLAPISPQASDIEELVRRSGCCCDGHAQIDLLYTVVLKSVLEDEETNEEEKNDVRAVLNTVLLAQEPIGIQTIAVLGGVGDTSRVEYALRSLSSVLYESGTGLVSTLHASFPDFMFDEKRSGTYFATHQAQSTGGAAMLRGDEETATNEHMQLPSSFMRDKDVKNLNELIESNISPLLAYVCRYWANHLRPVLEVDEMQAALDEFLSTRLLFWMEVLSVRGDLSTGVAQRLNQPRISTSRHSHSVRDQAMYTSTTGPDARAGGAEGQSDGPQRDSRTGHLEHSLAKLLASGSMMAPSECGTCAPALLLPAHSAVTPTCHSVSFSPDSKRIVSGSGQDRFPFRAYSPDGTLIASASYDNYPTVALDDGTPAASPLQGHTDSSTLLRSRPMALDLSAVIRQDRSCVEGVGWLAVATPFQGHSGASTSVAVSADGMLVASGSDDRTVRVWRMSDGSLAAVHFLAIL
ncbi:WD repeat-containing protein [Rhizoctonia solani]|uniref:WD repeat-containing protein n=1 Tax=Rhizoctonia solani TaxID=456999 RepID=A0A8H7M0I9_9AGAM|nr:WD repeat-containing protein [Rhizoctonia solani]